MERGINIFFCFLLSFHLNEQLLCRTHPDMENPTVAGYVLTKRNHQPTAFEIGTSTRKQQHKTRHSYRMGTLAGQTKDENKPWRKQNETVLYCVTSDLLFQVVLRVA